MVEVCFWWNFMAIVYKVYTKCFQEQSLIDSESGQRVQHRGTFDKANKVDLLNIITDQIMYFHSAFMATYSTL